LAPPPRPPAPPLFPYTTLFRSGRRPVEGALRSRRRRRRNRDRRRHLEPPGRALQGGRLVARSFGRRRERVLRSARGSSVARISRSEEHTSELQSLRHLVCRLLL